MTRELSLDDLRELAEKEVLKKQIELEEAVDRYVRKLFPGSLDNHGDAVQIRKVGDRLTWIRSNKPEEKWQELTPELARQIEVGAVLEGQKIIDAEIAEKLKAIKIGWYQDAKGQLYQFDGTTWLGKIPGKDQIEELEYLGN